VSDVSDAESALTATVRRFARSALGREPSSLSEIAGGASPRRFFRVVCGDGPRAVCMYLPPGCPELEKARELGRPLAFLEVRELLAERGVRVPALFAEAAEHGLLLVEDLGETIAQHLRHSPGDRRALYELAVAELARAQRALVDLPADSIVRTRAFDEPLLGWEIDHFREWGLEARGAELDANERAAFDAVRDYLARTISAWPRGFVHRDYQSRNLLVSSLARRELGWIDFQDALLGPRAYDLVALLNDSYLDFDRDFIEARLDEFAALSGMPAGERVVLGREFDLISVQRKLKDAGRFVFIERSKGDASFLPYFAPTLHKVRRSLEHLKDVRELDALRSLLERHCSC
jgi:aminoglycoside/choline kinase family phosphotransferase